MLQKLGQKNTIHIELVLPPQAYIFIKAKICIDIYATCLVQLLYYFLLLSQLNKILSIFKI